MSKLNTWLTGYRTWLCVIGIILVTIAHSFWPQRVSEYMWFHLVVFLAAGSLGFLRAAVGRELKEHRAQIEALLLARVAALRDDPATLKALMDAVEKLVAAPAAPDVLAPTTKAPSVP